jgi:hypothetical protein
MFNVRCPGFSRFPFNVQGSSSMFFIEDEDENENEDESTP